jgi:hypothetical protein
MYDSHDATRPHLRAAILASGMAVINLPFTCANLDVAGVMGGRILGIAFFDPHSLPAPELAGGHQRAYAVQPRQLAARNNFGLVAAKLDFARWRASRYGRLLRTSAGAPDKRPL